MVVEANPVTNDPAGVLQMLRAVAVHALILEFLDHPLDHPIGSGLQGVLNSCSSARCDQPS